MAVAALVIATCSGCGLIYDSVGGAFVGEPGELDAKAGPVARRLIAAAFEGLAGRPVVDFHVHLVTRDVHPDWLSWWHPIKRARTMVYLSASGIELGSNLELAYVMRLVELARAFPHPVRIAVLAMDRYWRPDGTVDLDRTTFYVSNRYAFDVARRYPDIFFPVISVHPYRPDALDELERWARRGCGFVKWLPNAMGMDPSDSRIAPFYRLMAQYDMVLLTHTGEEHAIEAEDSQRLGNPLLLKKPLDLGVRVVAYHSASLGEFEDLEDPERRRVPGFELLCRMLDDPAYDGLLFGGTASLTFYNHLDAALLGLLERDDLHDRFGHGSDYPLVGINVVIQTSALADAGFITAEERGGLNEIYGYNPLLFDFVVKRTVRHPQTERKLAASVFVSPFPLDDSLPPPDRVE